MLAANLYRVLGKKTNIESKDTQDEKVKFVNKNTENFDTKLNSNEEELINADKTFTIDSFLRGAESAFKIIVSSYKDNNIESAESLLSPKVLKAFQEQTDAQSKIKAFQITDIKSSIIKIEMVKKLAKIKVMFLSTQKNILEKKDETIDVKDVWTFEKIIGSKDPTWILSEVTSE